MSVIVFYFWHLSFSPLSLLIDYAALLSRHSSLSPTTSSSIATGRFYFRKKALTYSFVTSPGFGFPTTLTFLDGNSNIIEEFPLRPTHFQVHKDYIVFECNIDRINKFFYISTSYLRYKYFHHFQFYSNRTKLVKFVAHGNGCLDGIADNYDRMNSMPS